MSRMTTESAPAEEIEFDSRYYVQTAKNAIESLIQIVEEAISNEDEAISRRSDRDGGEDKGTIIVSYDPEEMRLTVTGDGDGMTAAAMRERLRVVGASPQKGAKRGFFHRGIREVFLAMGGGEVISIGMTSDGRQVLSRAAFEAEPKMKLLAEDEVPAAAQRAELGLEKTGTVVRIPMRRFAKKKPHMFEFGPLERQIRDCVGLRSVLADPSREVFLKYGEEPPRRLVFEYPESDDLIAERTIEVDGETGSFWAKLAKKPVKRNPSKRARIAGILIRGDRAAYEVSLGHELSSHPAMGRVIGELRIDGIEQLQREADDDSQLVYKTDRSGLNPEHPLVEKIYELIDETLGPLIADLDSAEDRKRTTPDMRRELQKLARVINEAIAGTSPSGPEERGGETAEEPDESKEEREPPEPPDERRRELEDALEFPYDRVFVNAGQSRSIKVWFDGSEIAEGSSAAITTSPDEVVPQETLSADSVPAPAKDGIAELTLTIKAGNTEGRHEVTVRSAGYEATLPVHVRFPRASGFISQIIPDNQDWEAGSAFWDPSTGVVRVFIGRPEFKEAETRAHRSGVSDAWRQPEYRQLVVESVRESALWEAAARRAEIEWDELPTEERRDGNAFHNLVRYEFQELDYLLRAKLHKAFAQT